MKKISCICLLGLGLALLVSGAAAQENFVNHGVAGVRGLHGAVLPPHDIFSNCGTGCSSYDTGSGYYVSGTGSGDGPGQTLAIGFTPTMGLALDFVLTPNSNYTGVAGGISAYLLNGTATGGPTTLFATLVQGGTIPDYPTLKSVHYKSKTAVHFKKGVTYFLCETASASDVTTLWMLSSSDTSSPFWYQDAGSCTATGLTWLNATGIDAPAFKVRGT